MLGKLLLQFLRNLAKFHKPLIYKTFANRKKQHTFSFAFVFLLLLGLSENALGKTWQGDGVGNLWSVPTNWVEGSIPLANEDVIIPAGNPCNVTAGAVAASVEVELGGVINIGNADITLSDYMQITGILNINAGKIFINNLLLISAGGIFQSTGAATIEMLGDIDNNGTVDCNDATTFLMKGIKQSSINDKNTTLKNSFGRIHVDKNFNNPPISVFINLIHKAPLLNRLEISSGDVQIDGICTTKDLYITQGTQGNISNLTLTKDGQIITTDVFVIGGNLTLSSTVTLQVLGNWQQQGVTGSFKSVDNQSTTRVSFLGNAPSIISSDAPATPVNIEANVLIDKNAGINVQVTAIWNIGNAIDARNLTINSGTLNTGGATQPTTVFGDLIQQNGGIINAELNIQSPLYVYGNWNSSAANVVDHILGQLDVRLVGTVNKSISTANVVTPTNFFNLFIEKGGPGSQTLIDHQTTGPIRILNDLYINTGHLIMRNVVNTVQNVAVGEGNVSIPDADLFVGRDLVLLDKASLDIGSNEPSNGVDALDKLIIAVHIGGSLQDNNSTYTDPSNINPRAGLYIGVGGVNGDKGNNPAIPMGKPNNGCIKGTDYIFDGKPLKRDLRPVIVFVGKNSGVIKGNYTNLRNYCNNLSEGKGTYLPHTIVFKNDNTASVLLETGARVLGHMAVVRGKFDINGQKLLFGNQFDAITSSDIIDVYSVLNLPAGSTLLMNGNISPLGTMIRVRKGGLFRAVGTYDNRVNISRDGPAGTYYRIAVYAGGAIETAYTDYMQMVGNEAGTTTKPANPPYCKPITSSLYDIKPTFYDLADLPGSGFGGIQSTGGIKVLFGAKVNPNNATSKSLDLDIPIVDNNFSYCRFGNGGTNSTSLTINTGQTLNIVGADFAQGTGTLNFTKNCVANPNDPNNPANCFIQGGIITFIKSSGALGGIKGEKFDGGLNDDVGNQDRIRWVTFPLFYWVGSYNQPGFRVGAQEAVGGVATAWDNYRNWSLRNTDYHNPNGIYPGAIGAAIPPIFNPAQHPDTLQKFEVMITRTAPSQPTVNINSINIQGSVYINSGISVSDASAAADYVDASTDDLMKGLDIVPQIANPGTSNVSNKTLTIDNNFSVEGDLIVEVNGAININGGIDLKVGGNLAAFANLPKDGNTPPALAANTPQNTNIVIANVVTILSLRQINMTPTSSLTLNGEGEQEIRVGRNYIANLIIDKVSGGIAIVQGLRPRGNEVSWLWTSNVTIKEGELRLLTETPLMINGNMTINGGKFSPLASSVIVRGNWNNTGGEVDPGSSLIHFHPNDVAKTIRSNAQSFNKVNFGHSNISIVKNGYYFDVLPENFPAETWYPNAAVPNGVVNYTLLDNFTANDLTTVYTNRTVNTGAFAARLTGLTIKTGGRVNVDPSGELQMNTISTLLVEANGRLNVLGNPNSFAKITRQGINGFYTFTVNGVITARYYLMEFMNASGINLTGGGSSLSVGGIQILDAACNNPVIVLAGSFSDGILTNGENVAGATYLNLPAGYAASNIYNVSFPAVLATGSNVKHLGPLADPNITFIDASGGFAGEEFDQDPLLNDPAPGGNILWNTTVGVKRWTGKGLTNKWSNPNNWNPIGVPLPCQNVILDLNDPGLILPSKNGYVVEIDNNIAAICKDLSIVVVNKVIELRMTGTGTLTLNGSLSSDAPGLITAASVNNKISIAKNWINKGTYTYNPLSGNTVSFPIGGTRVISTAPNLSAFYNIHFANGYTELNSNLNVDNNLIIGVNLNAAPTAVLDASNGNDTINLKGDWLNNNFQETEMSFVPRQGTVIFSTGANKIRSINKVVTTTPENFFGLIINKNADDEVILNTRVVIGTFVDDPKIGQAGVLTLNNGIFSAKSGKELILAPTSSWTRSGFAPLTSAFVTGPVGRIFTSSNAVLTGTYPIGYGGSNYVSGNTGTKLKLTLTESKPTTFIMEQVDNDPENDPGNGIVGPNRTLPPTINQLSKNRYWFVKNINYPPLANKDLIADIQAGTGSIEIPFDATVELGNFPIIVNGTQYDGLTPEFVSKVSILQDYNQNFTMQPNATFQDILMGNFAVPALPGLGGVPNEWRDMGGTADLQANVATMTSEVPFYMLGNGQFTFGWFFDPLPVELVDLQAQVVNNSVNLTWITASEKDTKNFAVERSRDGKSFSLIGNVVSAGNSNTLKSYNFSDVSPASGLNYYRLKQEDINGDYTYSKVVAASVSGGSSNVVNVYPNPVETGNSFTIAFPTALNGNVKVVLIDMTGKVVHTQVATGENKSVSVQPTSLTSGIYVVRIETDTQIYYQRLSVR